MEAPRSATDVVPAAAPPGWYPDPVDGRAARWWDGNAWTAAARGAEVARASAVGSHRRRWAYAGVAATVAGGLAVILLF